MQNLYLYWGQISRFRVLQIRTGPSKSKKERTKRRLHDRKPEHFKALSKNCQTSAIVDHITSTGHNIKWDHFEFLATGRSDIHCTIKEPLLIKDLKPSLNEKVGSEKLFLC